MKYCLFCMTKVDADAEYCPACSRVFAYDCPSHHLLPGSVLNKRYLIGAALGEGGFGITYLGRDLNLDIRVAVKEFYPYGFAQRNNTISQGVTEPLSEDRKEFFEKGRRSFLREARSLARFKGESGIVDVQDFFEENNTAYIVMEYLDGVTLKKYLQEHGPIPSRQTVEMMLPVMRSLEKVHREGVIHRDISPDNIMLVGGSVKLLDFGAARDVSPDANRSLSVLLKPGYAPEEQYRSRGKQGPWTDIYALCATMYKCVTGVTPEESNDRAAQDDVKRPSELGVDIDPRTERVIMKGMAVYAANRYQSIGELLVDLTGNDNRPSETVRAEEQTAAGFRVPETDREATEALTAGAKGAAGESEPTLAAGQVKQSGQSEATLAAGRIGKADQTEPTLAAGQIGLTDRTVPANRSGPSESLPQPEQISQSKQTGKKNRIKALVPSLITLIAVVAVCVEDVVSGGYFDVGSALLWLIYVAFSAVSVLFVPILFQKAISEQTDKTKRRTILILSRLALVAIVVVCILNVLDQMDGYYSSVKYLLNRLLDVVVFGVVILFVPILIWNMISQQANKNKRRALLILSLIALIPVGVVTVRDAYYFGAFDVLYVLYLLPRTVAPVIILLFFPILIWDAILKHADKTNRRTVLIILLIVAIVVAILGVVAEIAEIDDFILQSAVDVEAVLIALILNWNAKSKHA